MPVGELSRPDEPPRAGEKQFHSELARRGFRKEPQRATKKHRGARGSAQRGRLPGLTQSRNGSRVAAPRRALNMMRALGSRRAAGAKRVGAALVRPQSPTAERRLIDPPSNERVPKAKAAGHLCLADEIELQQLVQGLERRRFGDRRRGRHKLGLKRVAGHCCPLQCKACASRQESELLAQRDSNRGRHAEILARELGNTWGVLKIVRPGELLEVERVATALLVQSAYARGGDGFT